tara:strand:+ start:6026 stop:7096 length:1071 start_codon:yes stop_codon:yes gene_type:complete
MLLSLFSLYLLAPRNFFGYNIEFIIFSFLITYLIFFFIIKKIKIDKNILLFFIFYFLYVLLNAFTAGGGIFFINELFKEASIVLLTAFVVVLLNLDLDYSDNKSIYKIASYILIFNLFISLLQVLNLTFFSYLYSQDNLEGRASGIFKYLHTNVYFSSFMLLILIFLRKSLYLKIFAGMSILATASKLAIFPILALYFRSPLSMGFLSLLVGLMIFFIGYEYLDLFIAVLIFQLENLFYFQDSLSYTNRFSSFLEIYNFNLTDLLFGKDRIGAVELNSHRAETMILNTLYMQGIVGVGFLAISIHLLLKNIWLSLITIFLCLVGSPLEEPKALIALFFLAYLARFINSQRIENQKV